MKLKHTNNFIKKDTVAIFVKVEKEKEEDFFNGEIEADES